ncbi:helix-turn-helix transcriptional regulator [Hwanghaeella grinnelliae]|uniref:helix-turn-helix transcriptional regulator n=1 Tax=Hwanghaeella grinnelliae TaxID=2500179 RepID=UPI00195F4C82|nr:LuxR C-terminal-related transcriptional regulator [Hwanghaeella grinnelliae]
MSSPRRSCPHRRQRPTGQTVTLSPGTVAHHIKSIYRKLGISSRAEASWHAARLGLTPGEKGGKAGKENKGK